MTSSISAFLGPFVALVYPAYASYKAVETPQPDDDTQWLMYWIIVAIFQVMEVFTDMLVYWMPLYFEFKLIALIVLQNPTLRLPSTLYSKVVKPYILPHETAIDEFLSRSYLHMISRVADGLQWVVQNGPTLLSSVTAGVKAGVDAAKSNAAEEHRRQLVRKETHDLTVKVSNKIKGN